jgi:hypothetical protein
MYFPPPRMPSPVLSPQIKTSLKASPSLLPEPWVDELTALDKLTLKASMPVPFLRPVIPSEAPDDKEWTELQAESEGKKTLGGTAYNSTSDNAFSKPIFGGLSCGVRR